MSEIKPIEAYAILDDGKLNADFVYSADLIKECYDAGIGLGLERPDVIRVVIIPIAPEKNDAVV